MKHWQKQGHNDLHIASECKKKYDIIVEMLYTRKKYLENQHH